MSRLAHPVLWVAFGALALFAIQQTVLAPAPEWHPAQPVQVEIVAPTPPPPLPDPATVGSPEFRQGVDDLYQQLMQR